MGNQIISMLLVAFAVALVGSAVVCGVALGLFPWFRSGERKAGSFRPDESTGNFRVNTVKRGKKEIRLRVSSNELPLVGGVAMILAIAGASIAGALWMGLDTDGWTLLAILLLAMLGFGLVGFMDDARKVYKGVGISEIQKFVGILFVSLAAAAALNRLVFQGVNGTLSARLAYSPYKDIPILGHLLVDYHFTWIIFFLLMTATITTSTALAVDFSDGMDGLSGGLLLSAALSFAAIMLNDATAPDGNPGLWPAILAALAIAGATLGYLPFNWPSSWRGRGPAKAKRRARLIMGDTGSLALGGLLALIAIVSRLELLLIFIGGVFVLEGLSALISARILVKFFRVALFHERYRARRGFPHTELPLPFLATPMHHHYDLLGWDRKRLVYSAWLLGAGLGVLGVASVIGTFTWERYLARFVSFLILLAVWQSGTLTRGFFIGLIPTGPAKPAKDAKDAKGDAPGEPRRLALYYGLPFKLFGRPLYAMRDATGLTEDALATPAEHLTLWTRMNVFDARALLGLYCYRAGALRDAVRIWEFIPQSNLYVRPQINQMLLEARNRMAMESEVDVSDPQPRAEPPAEPAPEGGAAHGRNGTGGPAIGDARGQTLPPARIGAGIGTGRLQPMPVADIQPDPLPPEALLWSAEGWVAATTTADPNAATDHMPAVAADAPPAASNGAKGTNGPRRATPAPAYHLAVDGMGPGSITADDAGEN